MPVDYLSGLGPLPNPAEALNKELAFRANLEQSRAQTAQAQVGMEADRQKMDRQSALEHALSGSDGSAASVSRIMMQFPEAADEIKKGWDVKDSAARQTDLTQLGEIYSAANSGNYELAAKAARARLDADKAAGQADASDEAIVSALESGDPAKQKAALTMIGTHLAAATGAEHFGTVYGALNDKKTHVLGPGAVLVGDDNQIVAHSPLVQGADGTLYDYNSVMGGGQGSSPPMTEGKPASMTPAVKAVASTLSASLPAPVVAGFLGNFHVEGGYTGAQGDGGSASGIAQWHNDRAANFERVIGKPVTEATPEDQAKFVLHEMQHPEEAGMTVAQRDQIMSAKTPGQAAALIDKFYERSDGKARGGRMAAANAFAGVQGAPASGGPKVLLPGKGKEAPSGWRWSADGQALEPIPNGPADQGEKFTILTPAEAESAGLDPAIKFQKNTKTGQITAISGQSKAQLKPWPAPALDARTTNTASLQNIDNALKLLDPKNNTPQAKAARNAIGPTNKVIPNWVLQQSDPSGNEFRGLLGQVGGVIIKDISGAAVSASEDERLQKWVPSTTDTPQAAASKLRNLKREIMQRNQAMDSVYSEDQGFRPFGGKSAAPVKVRSVQEAQKLAPGTLFVTPDGRTLRKK